MNKTNNSIIQPDHVHIMFETKPSIILTQVICTLKSYSTKILLKKFKTTLSVKYWKPHLWSPSYCLCTVSERSATVVKNYINTQDFFAAEPPPALARRLAYEGVWRQILINILAAIMSATLVTVGSTDTEGDFSNYVIPSKVVYMTNTFSNCTALTGTITINANPTSYNYCFYNVDFTAQNLTLTGDSTVLAELGATGTNYQG